MEKPPSGAGWISAYAAPFIDDDEDEFRSETERDIDPATWDIEAEFNEPGPLPMPALELTANLEVPEPFVRTIPIPLFGPYPFDLKPTVKSEGAVRNWQNSPYKVVAVVLVGLIIAWFAMSRLDASTNAKPTGATAAVDATPTPDQVLSGYTATVTLKGNGYPCFDTRDSLDAASQAYAANDTRGFANAAIGHIVRLAAGDRVRGIDTSGISDLRIRIESGPNSGTACWVPTDNRALFKNIRDELR